MKKIGLVALTAAAAALLSGCSKSSSDVSMPKDSRENVQAAQDRSVAQAEIIDPTFGVSRRKSALSGGFRIIRGPIGEYTTEYVHISQSDLGGEKPNYSLNLKDDNTFTFHAEVNGVNSDHYGNWYLKYDDSIILFYDEPVETPPHNVFIGDCMFMELLPQGKIMFYDDCATIVLSKKADAAPQNVNS